MKTIITVLVCTMILSMGWAAPIQAEHFPSAADDDQAANMGDPISPSSIPVITVNNTGDQPKSGALDVCETAPGNGQCTLRAAIQTAEAAYGDNPVRIDVNVSTIMPNSALPEIRHNNLTIMGNSVFLSGLLAGADASGFTIHWSANENVRIQGFTINGFNKHGIHIMGHNHIIGVDGDGVNDENEGNVIYSNGEYGIFIDAGNSNRISGNQIGTSAGGNQYGIVIQGAIGTLVGTDGDGTSDVLERNIISNNTLDGIWMTGTTHTTIAGNYIGTSADGTSALGNRHGVVLQSSPYNFIGTNGDGTGDAIEGNLISGNYNTAVRISGLGSKENRVAGNFIGTNAEGTSALAFNRYGIVINDGASKNIIGTNGDGISDSFEGNLISGNTFHGVEITGPGTIENRVAGNFIGTNASGTSALANDHGVVIYGGASNNIIGTNGDGNGDSIEGNLISGNKENGVHIFGPGTDENWIAGNLIGLNIHGNSPIANYIGVYIDEEAQNNIVGTNLDYQSDMLERNIISGNAKWGIQIAGTNTLNNKIYGNYIGLDASGLVFAGHYLDEGGILLTERSAETEIGCHAVACRNVIAGPYLFHIKILDSQKNTIRGNFIGTDKSGVKAIPGETTGVYGIYITGKHYVNDNTIGGISAGAGNTISGRISTGIYIDNYWTSGIMIIGNNIGVGSDGITPVGNRSYGISIRYASRDITIGGVTAGAGNIIANNGKGGIITYHNVNRIAIRGNNIYNNGDFGIQHRSQYANNGQVYPDLSKALMLDSGGLQILGSLTSTPDTDFDLDFFVNEACDPSGYGQGQQYISSKTLAGTPSGSISFSHTIAGSFTPGHVITATATDKAGNSSEFSTCILIKRESQPGDPVSANFSASPTHGTAPLTVTFTDESTGDYETCDWDFGDGNVSENCNNPSHTYQSNGTYTVTLTVSGGGGTDTKTQPDFIRVTAEGDPVTADFIGTPTSGPAPLTVAFTNRSEGDYDTCTWNFGDGNASDNCNNPSHIFQEEGLYTVNLTVSGGGGTDTLTRTNYITIGHIIFLPLIQR